MSWVQDKDHILRDGDNRKISFEKGVATLVVPKADLTSAGTYTCQLRNDSGVVECVSQVTVLGLYYSRPFYIVASDSVRINLA